MPVHRRMPSKDEELGKRNDDFRPKRASSLPTSLTQPWRWRKRRVVMVLAGIVLLYFFIQNIPVNLGPLDEKLGLPLSPGHVVHGAQEIREPRGPPPPSNDDDSDVSEEVNHYYNGPIKFYRLATSLRGIYKTQGGKAVNRNILFAASSLKSVANLMPMACAMGRWERNYVHMAILGRDTLPLEDILEVNGVSTDTCTVYFHDARGDFAEYSTDVRMEAAIRGAMKHVNDFMHPQAIIMDDSSLEDSFFTSAMRTKATEFRRALIEVPEGKYEDWLWMTRLNSESLASWFRPSIEILVHAPTGSSGGLLRLVKSLQKADYSGLSAPRLTIELPSDIEYFAKKYLKTLDWPPEQRSPLAAKGLVLRHRIPSSRVTSEQASLRFLESFYPASTEDDHVLILSPQVELSPLYYQYLHYAILEYRYSSYELAQEDDDLLGVALDVPTVYVNGTSGFKPPIVADVDMERMDVADDLELTLPAPFRYEIPSSTASLIFGDKWATLHDFLSNRLAATHAGKAERTYKLVSETEPAWLEHLLELMRARSWTMLHPAAPLVTLHNELARIPEEFMQTHDRDDAEPAKSSLELDEEPYLTAAILPTLKRHVEEDTDRGSMSLHKILPFDGDLPQLSSLPYVYHTGEIVSTDDKNVYRDRYQRHFRRHIGGCDGTDADRRRNIHALSTDDLFCLPGTEADYDEEGDESRKQAEIGEAILKATSSNSSDETSTTAGRRTSNIGGGKDASKATVETGEETEAEKETDDN